jgi:dipeptide/tripeptide permease
MFPPGIPYIVGNEAAERFSYYGMRQILYIYLVGLLTGFAAEQTLPAATLGDAKVRATQVVHAFMAGVYIFPMIGAILADRYWGKYNVIFRVSLVYVTGHAALAVAGRLGNLGQLPGAEVAMLAGLALIAIGSGGIKPCVSANVGDQFTQANSHLVPQVFQIFYFTINFGSFFACLLTPYLYKHYGPELAFGVPGLLMAAAALVFRLGRSRFVHIAPNPGGALGRTDFFAAALLLLPLLLALAVAVEKAGAVVEATTRNGIQGLSINHRFGVRLHTGAKKDEIDHHGILDADDHLRQRAGGAVGAAGKAVAHPILLAVRRPDGRRNLDFRSDRVVLSGQNLPSARDQRLAVASEPGANMHSRFTL